MAMAASRQSASDTQHLILLSQTAVRADQRAELAAHWRSVAPELKPVRDDLAKMRDEEKKLLGERLHRRVDVRRGLRRGRALPRCGVRFGTSTNVR